MEKLVRNKKATISIIIAMATFGTVGFVAPKTGLKAIDLVYIRCTFASIFLFAVWYLSGLAKKEIYNKKDISLSLLSGILLVLNWVCLFKSFENLSVTISVSIYYLAPVILFLLGSFVYKEKITVVPLLGVLSSFIGSILLSGINSDFSVDKLLSSGVIWAFLAAIFYGILMVVNKGITKTSSYFTTLIQTTLGFILLIPFVKFNAFQHLNFENWSFILIIGFVHTGIIYALFFGNIRFLPSNMIAVLTFLDPAVAILLDTVITGFKPTSTQITGIFMTFLGIALIMLLNSPKKIAQNSTNKIAN
ncbi:DMT family transporter [Gottfriedia luciferensis]|uniref:DMT family transporter n=1 Tax=Gottfriedia luciferensis TaxID=178774 RepID=UPI001F1D453D|nr:DMT family transporter [Gottfriedia luciferensis]